MKQVLLGVVVVGVLVGAGILAFRSGSGGSGGSATPTSGSGIEEVEGPVGPEVGAPVPTPDDEALARLREEIDRAEPVTVRSDAEILAAAQAWVSANRDPDNPYNELEAKMLALMDSVFDGTERSAEWVLNMQEIEIEMIRALDTDGDGVVSDEEVVSFTEMGITAFNPVEHPYLKDRFDLDGDGDISTEELQKLGSENIAQSALAGAMERAKIESWDTDMDGVLSAEERASGQANVQSNLKVNADGSMEFVTDPSEIDPTEQEAAFAQIAETMGEEVAETLRMQHEAYAAQSVAQSLLEDMRLETMDQQELQKMAMDNMPVAPTQDAYDTDGDGALSAEESAALMAAVEEYQQTMMDYGAVQMAEMMRMQFEHATSESDADGDGRLLADEWEDRIGELHEARDERLWLRSYDTDGSGRVEADELDQYVGWFREGSLRADTNYDGSVDALDLQAMATRFQAQLR